MLGRYAWNIDPRDQNSSGLTRYNLALFLDLDPFLNGLGGLVGLLHQRLQVDGLRRSLHAVGHQVVQHGRQDLEKLEDLRYGLSLETFKLNMFPRGTAQR